MNEWQKIDINEIPYSEQSISKIIDILTKGYQKFSDYLDKNFLNDLKRFQNQSPVKIYHPEIKNWQPAYLNSELPSIYLE